MNEEILRAILALGLEDHSGLWESRWEVARLSPELSATAVHETARKAVDFLTREGYLSLSRGRPTDRQTVSLSFEETQKVLSSEIWWDPPRAVTDEAVWIEATPRGSEAYGHTRVLGRSHFH